MSKGARTKETIVAAAMKAASVEGFNGLSIGNLATRLGMSKSGLFAHFGSKEELQKAVMDASSQLFLEAVWKPARATPRGLPRLRKLFDLWLAWMDSNPDLPGGCILTAAATEMDDKPGPVRDKLVAMQNEWMATLARGAELAVNEGHFRADLDCQQFAFELSGIVFSLSFYTRLLRDPQARFRAEAAFDDLIRRAAPAPAIQLANDL
ncbi:TetR/AcrR family transcriptional regulator [Ferrovibrio sp.]|uniref:TetR/AcrR family transcriptional regulator n=1 Tax=Ferrovibrio sp. TaxID=1917215 RepID=UPI001B7CD5B8|nr:TetR/AcrR family transcriptional regulator [Ferrovibrio sp.]MBP7063091.1 TetR/AcrR family transcriptional regulator [Ferrovibrio sp.]